MTASAVHALPRDSATDPAEPPRHVAIIMDGNGRWAKARGLPRSMGHRKGAEALKNLLSAANALGIRYMTLYAFSAENWSRPEAEVSDLMGLLQYYLEKEAAILKENRIRLHVIGNLENINNGLKDKINSIVEETKTFDSLHLTIALSYGARQEMTHAVRQIVRQVESGTLSPADITEQTIGRQLYTHELPDPDLLIRTGGEQRLSNFLLWQSAYTELYFTEVFWPDFTGKHLQEAIHVYHQRERRYGTV